VAHAPLRARASTQAMKKYCLQHHNTPCQAPHLCQPRRIGLKQGA